MALKKNFSVEYRAIAFLPWGEMQLPQPGVYILEGAHIKVVSTEGTKQQQRALVQITAGEKQIVKIYDFAPDIEGPNFIAQAYAHLKTLPEFSGAVDC
jgi:hypothetical protein